MDYDLSENEGRVPGVKEWFQTRNRRAGDPSDPLTSENLATTPSPHNTA